MKPSPSPCCITAQASIAQPLVQNDSFTSHCSPSSSTLFPHVKTSWQVLESQSHVGPLSDGGTEASQCSRGSIAPFPQMNSTQLSLCASQTNPVSQPSCSPSQSLQPQFSPGSHTVSLSQMTPHCVEQVPELQQSPGEQPASAGQVA